MTRAYTAKRLLEHGPLTWRELRQITGWPEAVLRGAMGRLMDAEQVVSAPVARGRFKVYRLAA